MQNITLKLKIKKAICYCSKKVTTEIIFILMSDYNIKNIEVKQSTYGSIYIEFYESTIRISDHEIDTINYSYQIIINNYRIDKINRQELTKIIY